ncbi:phage terminase large subunit family protein [Methylobacterium sp. SI9]|uniref:phage terminase large subunit family protein n=1 Tax=Methylobacterium guangdongense TaxID=3138811 RepID=UPI00313D3250
MPEATNLNGAEQLRARIARAFLVFKPPPRLSLIEWADTYRRVSSKNSAQPGQWRTAVQPAAMGPMLAVTQRDTFIVTVVAATQVLKSELLMNTAFYFIHLDPSPILFVQPSQKAAEAFSKERFQPTVAETPVLRELIKAPKARGSENTITHKDYPGGSLDFVGSESPTDLASRPKRVVLCDEINKYPPSAGKEGDPLLLAEERASTYKDVRRHKFVRVCSPTVKDACRITGEYEKSDRRQCFVACLHCEHEQTLAWSQVRWLKVLEDGTETYDPPPNAEVVYHKAETAVITCTSCGEPWTETERREALRALEHRSDYGWRQTARFTCCGEEQTPGLWDDEGRSVCEHCGQRSTFDGHAGFHVSKLLSARHRLADVVREFIQARRDPEALRKWTNTGLAETWEHQAGEGMDGSGLINRAEPYGPDDLPDAVRIVTGFCDVQGDRLEMQLVGWGQDEEAWPFLYEVINLDPAEPQAWRELDALRARVFTTAEGRKLRIAAFGVDVGGLNHAAQAVAYCRRRRGQRVFATIGRGGKYPIWPLRSSRSKANDKIWLMGVDAAKDAIYARLKIEPLAHPEDGSAPKPHPGLIHFPMHESFGPDYFEQLTAERREVRRRLGQQVVVWITPKGKRNEALDTFVGCLAVRKALSQRIERGLEYGVGAPAETPTPQTPATPPSSYAPPPPAAAPPQAAPRAPQHRGSSYLGRQSGWLR